MITITSFAAAVDATVSELKLEAFLPADQATATALTHLVDVWAQRSVPKRPPSLAESTEPAIVAGKDRRR